MAFIPPLVARGVALGAPAGAAGATAAGIVGGMAVATTVGSLAGVGVSIAGATGAFDPDYPDVPTPETSQDAADARKRAVTRAQRGITEQPPQTHKIGTEPVQLGQPTIVGGQ